MTPEEIHKEVIEEWETVFQSFGATSPYDEEFATNIAALERSCEEEVVQYLQPWFQILEDCIQWLANLVTVLTNLNEAQNLSSHQQSIWVLTAASCTYAMAVRRLVLAGLDTPAKAAARSLDEHLCACVALLNNPALAEQFHNSQSEKDSADFWYKNLSTKALKKHLNAAERNVGIDPQISEALRKWRDEEVGLFSQAVHPSYIFSALTAVTPSAKGKPFYGTAYLGRASAFSERTLGFACKSIWYFSRFGFVTLYKDEKFNECVAQLKNSDEFRRMAFIGREVIGKSVSKYWHYKIYPAEDYELEGDT